MQLNQNIIHRLTAKASKSICRYRVSAIGFNSRGEILATAFNTPFVSKYCGFHAEASLMADYGGKIKTIIIARIGRKNDLLPIHACSNCQAMADKLGIKIIPLLELLK